MGVNKNKNRNNYRDVVAIRRRIYGELKSIGIRSFDSKPLSGCKNKDLFELYKSNFDISEESLKELIKSLNIKNKVNKVSSVYFIGNKEYGFVKIGYSNNPSKRLASLRVGCPFPIDIFRVIETSCPKTVEDSLHQIFRKQRCQGEWFTLEGYLSKVALSDDISLEDVLK